MHELSVTESILTSVLESAEKHGVTKILRIHLEIGELNDLKGEWIQHFFDYLSKDTIAADAKLRIERTPVVMECDECGHSFEVNIKEIKEIQCPECANKKCTLLSGKEYYIKDMEVL